jgi:hypothetical protein
MMSLANCVGNVKAHLRALYRAARSSMERVASEVNNYRRIQLTESDYGLYLSLRGPNFQLRCNAGETSSVDLSLDEARALFASITSACERQEMTKVEMRDLSWTTDARPNPKHPDRLAIRFSGQLGLGSMGLSRRRVLSACEEFSNIFGQGSTSPRGVSSND